MQKPISSIFWLVFLSFGSLTLQSGCGKVQEASFKESTNTPDPSSPPVDQPPGTEPPVEPPTEPPVIEPPVACKNPMPQIKTDCLPLKALSEIQKVDKGYGYTDPNKDSSFPKSGDPIQYRPPEFLIDLTKISAKTPVAENFVLEEFVSTKKGKFGLVLPVVIESAQILRNQLAKPLRINSAYRSPGYNSGTPGSAKWSRHMYGDAIDIGAQTTLQDLSDKCWKLGASFVLMYESHVHCDWRRTPLPDFLYGITDQLTSSEDFLPVAVIEGPNVVKKNSMNKYSANIVDEEEEGDLIVEWLLIDSQENLVENIYGQRINLKIKSAGQYILRALVGGTIVTEISITAE